MADLISRDTALKIYTDWTIDPEEAIVKLRAIPAIDPSAIREAALREAYEVVYKWWFGDGNALPQELILDLIGEKK